MSITAERSATHEDLYRVSDHKIAQPECACKEAGEVSAPPFEAVRPSLAGSWP